ncbi:quinone oxidoreductase family protein [Streptomyces heilongjiangensis]|uniref:Zinc-binding alcohol dehydrogenase family protein n=1 Tax=Streptomyces heilongjiangensis TaxID=945052 RepID=A0ABW1BCB0_9ACTN|nr:NADPH:quinone oxidoreductase family protein [Streptomyces heilongjiangensis]MDC2948759.1 NADPH:quinone oxidoreductase family protein [Streptomyces heilongjiangensis]
MRAVRLHEYGDPDVLRVEDVPIPEPGPGEVLIAAEAISVGFAQTQMRRNIFPAPMWKPEFPIVLGGDVIGRVAAIGPGVDHVREGDRVGAFTLHGAYAEYTAVDAATVLPVPEDLDAAQATALPSPGPIASGTIGTARLEPGESVLVHAASGGIGHLSVQLAKRLGAGPVIATAGSPAKLEFARSMGADVVVDYADDTWPDQVREATGGKGVDVILDSVGGDVLRQGVELLAPFGRLVFYGSAGGGLAVPAISPMQLIEMKYLTGFALSRWRATRPKEYLRNHEELAQALAEGSVRHVVHATLPLEDVTEAHRMIESRAHTGRIVLLPRS